MVENMKCAKIVVMATLVIVATALFSEKAFAGEGNLNKNSKVSKKSGNKNLGALVRTDSIARQNPKGPRMPQHIAASDLRLTWPGAISTEMTDDRVMPWRIPYVERILFAKELVEKTAMPAGVRIRFQSNTSSIEGFCNSFPERS